MLKIHVNTLKMNHYHLIPIHEYARVNKVHKKVVHGIYYIIFQLITIVIFSKLTAKVNISLYFQGVKCITEGLVLDPYQAADQMAP